MLACPASSDFGPTLVGPPTHSQRMVHRTMLIFATLSFLQMLVSARGATASKAVRSAEWMTPPRAAGNDTSAVIRRGSKTAAGFEATVNKSTTRKRR